MYYIGVLKVLQDFNFHNKEKMVNFLKGDSSANSLRSVGLVGDFSNDFIRAFANNSRKIV